MSLLLRIQHPDGRVYTYTDAEHLEESGEPTRQTTAGVDAVEVSDLELLIHGTLLGVSDIGSLPATSEEVIEGTGGTYRAEVVREDGTVWLNGIIRRRGGIVHEPEAQRWIVTVEDDAAKAFLEALEFDLAERLGRVQAAAQELGLELFPQVRRWRWTQVFEPPLGIRAEDQELIEPWFDVAALLLAAVRVTGHAWAGPGAEGAGPMFEHVARLLPGWIVRRPAKLAFAVVREGEIETEPTTLVGTTARTIYNAVAAMRGWRLLAAYGAFPDRTITATVVEDQDDDVVQAVVLDTLLEGGPGSSDAVTPRVIIEPPLGDLAFAYNNNPREETVSYWELDLGPWGEQYGVLMPPSAHDVRAAVQPLRLDTEGRPDHKDLVSLPFFLPYVGTDLEPGPAEEVEVGETTLTYRPDLARRLGFLSGDGRARTGLAIGELVPDPGSVFVYRYVAGHTWGPYAAPSAASARNHRMCYDVSLREAVELEVVVDVRDMPEGAIAVGNPARPVELEGQRWLVVAEEVGLDSKSARLTLRRPVGSLPAMSGEGGSVDARPTVSASFSCASYNPATGAGIVITFAWTQPEAAEAGPVHHYERRIYRSPSAGGNGWGPTQTTTATSETITSGPGTHNIMVRAVYDDGGPTAPRSHWGVAGVFAQCIEPGEIGEV